jgi:hypothetical protein
VSLVSSEELDDCRRHHPVPVLAIGRGHRHTPLLMAFSSASLRRRLAVASAASCLQTPNPLPVFPPLQVIRALDVPFYPATDLDHIRLDRAIG